MESPVGSDTRVPMWYRELYETIEKTLQLCIEAKDEAQQAFLKKFFNEMKHNIVSKWELTINQINNQKEHYYQMSKIVGDLAKSYKTLALSINAEIEDQFETCVTKFQINNINENEAIMKQLNKVYKLDSKFANTFMLNLNECKKRNDYNDVEMWHKLQMVMMKQLDCKSRTVESHFQKIIKDVIYINL